MRIIIIRNRFCRECRWFRYIIGAVCRVRISTVARVEHWLLHWTFCDYVIRWFFICASVRRVWQPSFSFFVWGFSARSLVSPPLSLSRHILRFRSSSHCFRFIRWFGIFWFFFCCFGALRVRSNSFNCPQTKWNKKKGHDAISAMCQNSVCEYICTHAANKRAHNANQSINDLVFIVRNTAMFVVVVLAVSISTLYLRLTFVIKCAMRSYRNIVLSHAH